MSAKVTSAASQPSLTNNRITKDYVSARSQGNKEKSMNSSSDASASCESISVNKPYQLQILPKATCRSSEMGNCTNILCFKTERQKMERVAGQYRCACSFFTVLLHFSVGGLPLSSRPTEPTRPHLKSASFPHVTFVAKAKDHRFPI